MTRDQFDQLVAKLQSAARKDPRAYNFRVGAMAFLGYGYIFCVLLLSILITIGIGLVVLLFPNGLTIKLGLFLGLISGGMAWSILRSLWVRLERPHGIELTQKNAPGIFSLLDDLRKRFNGPRFHHVLLMGDYNAAVVQVPRLGVFGWQRNYLILGLPLMQSLSPNEFEAVLAHEFGHLSRNHAKFSSWIYRVRRTWERVFEEMARRRQTGAIVLSKFLDWFWPLFNAHAFVLARVNEYEADRCSAEFSGAETAGQALMRVTLHGTFLEERFWPEIFKRTNIQDKPPEAVYAEMQNALRTPIPLEDSTRWLKTAFLLETNNGDTHPCLKDRLKALGVLPEGVQHGQFPSTVPPSPVSAAEHFLGPELPQFAAQLSERWKLMMLPVWMERHQQVQELDKVIADATGDGNKPSSIEQLWRKARAIIDKDGDEAALPVLEQLLTLDREHMGANFVWGRILLSKDDPCGIQFIERAVAKEETMTEAACELIYGFYVRTGQRDKLRGIEDRMDAFRERTNEALRERNDISPKDIFVPHEIKDSDLKTLRDLFESEPEIHSVNVARKQVKIFPNSPCYVFLIKIKVPFWKPRSSSANEKLLNRLLDKIPIHDQYILFVEDSNTKALAKKVAAVPGATIYARESGKKPK